MKEYNEKNFLQDVEYINKYNSSNKYSNKYYISTYGCQMNEHDSEKISWIMELLNYDRVYNEEDADFLIYNTCAIRENAELKVYGKIGSLKTLKKKNPKTKIALCGCMMQINSIKNTIIEKHGHVDIIFGTHNIHRLPNLIKRNMIENKLIYEIGDNNLDILESVDKKRSNNFSSYINIMYGCDNFCTYCIVPYTRGREFSRSPKDIIDEVTNLVKNGTKEIMLLGQNVNSYGKTLDFNYKFYNLIEDLAKVEGLKLIRFMTSHPKDISDDLINLYGKTDKLANHLHLPIQSGSNKILKKMNRNYTKEQYLNIVDKLRIVRPDISISTDLIIGFPGETEEDYSQTLELIKNVKFDFVYTFIYSKRPGTKAAKMKDQIPYKIKHRRFEEITNEINKISLKKNESLIGKKVTVLVEEISKNNPNMLSGRTSDFKLVHFEGDKSLIGEFVKVEITNATTFSLQAKRVLEEVYKVE